MLSNAEVLSYSKWFGLLTLVFAAITVLGFIFKWGIRFRLVGATAFMGVLTGGVIGLGLGLFDRTEIPNAVRYSRVFDNGAREIVIAVPSDISPTQLEATLQQAAGDLFSPGRMGRSDQFMTIRARTIIHPEIGVSEPVYVGAVKRSVYQREDNNLQIQVFSERLAHVQDYQSPQTQES
ncbi:MAG: Ycf51 family protein [Microcoleaceae cyanobacterium]